MMQPGPSITSSGNTVIQYNAAANGNSVKISIKHIYNAPETVVTDEGLSNTNAIPAIESQNDEEEVSSNNLTLLEDQNYLKNNEILELIWKYLPKKDKLNCTLVCKQFNSFVSSMDSFSLSIDMRLISFEKPIPILSRYYTTICIKHYEFYRLNSLVLQMLKHLSESVIRLKLIEIITSVKTLRELLSELPNLKSLQLIKIEFVYVKSSWKFKPKLLMLTNLEIEMMCSNNMSGVLGTFGSASKIQTISLFKMRLKVNELNEVLNQNENSLESLLLENCYTDFKEAKCIYSSFNNLHKLRKLYLIHCKDIPLKILKSEILYSLTDFEVEYNSIQKKEVYTIFQQYYSEKQINKNQLTKFETHNEPIKTKTLRLFSKKINTQFYYFHNCTSGSKTCDHNICKSVPLTNEKSNLNKNENVFSFFSIQVREGVKNFWNGSDVFFDCRN